MNSKNFTLKENFLTANCYYCIELNARNLVQCMLYLKRIAKSELFKPFLYDSQPCESLFRQLRSLSTVYSTVVNCTVKEAVSRVSKIQLQNQIIHLTSNNFQYPRFDKTKFVKSNEMLPSPDEIFREIEFCQTLAITTAKRLGLIEANNNKQQSCECKIKPAKPKTVFKTKQTHPYKSDDDDIDSIQLTANDLKNIQLKNYAHKVKPADVDGTGPYVKINCSNNKQIVVKKTSFCWLLGTDVIQLSSDRQLRVMHSTTEYEHFKELKLRKQIQQRSLHYPLKRLNARKKKRV